VNPGEVIVDGALWVAVPVAILAGLVFALILLVSFPWTLMLLASLGYVISLPYAWKSWKKHKKRDALKASGEEQTGTA